MTTSPIDMQVDESVDKSMLVVSVQSVAAGSVDMAVIYQSNISDEPFIQGEDYPALVRAWDNKNDDIFDIL